MRYALNVTPINGWETLLGQGQAGMTLAATGDGYRVFFAVGQTASMSLAASGVGLLVITGFAQGAALALASSGAGLKALTGTGTANQTLSAVGVPVLQARPIGQAGMALTVSGAAMKALLGAGLAAQAMNVNGTGYLVILGDAVDADMALDAVGDGFAAFFATGEPAHLALDADGVGYQEIHGEADDAHLTLDAAGVPILELKLGGEADMDLASAGKGILAALGVGQSDMAMDGIAGIPRPIIIPNVYAQTHASRFLVVEAFEQRIDAGNPSLPVAVSPDQRTLTVPAERSVA